MLTWILTHDFCPWMNRWVYCLKHPIASLGAAAVAALLCSLLVKPVVLVAFCSVLVVLLLGNLWPLVTVRGLSCCIEYRKERATEGDSVAVVVRVTNRWPWRIWGMVVELGERDRLALACVAGRSTAEFEWDFVPTCRGVYPQQPARMVTGFPFGLQMASRPARVAGSLIVWPRIVPLESLLDASETRPSEDRCSEHRIGDSGDMTGTRLFREGDSLRRVHWAQSVRQSRLIVCERQAPAQAAVRIVVDLNHDARGDSDPQGVLEWAIRVAASICVAYQREHAEVECSLGDETFHLAPGRIGCKRFLDAISRWHAVNRSLEVPADEQRTQKRSAGKARRNPGVFQVTVTTDANFGSRSENHRKDDHQRWIILNSDSFSGTCGVCGVDHATRDYRAMVLDRPDRVADDFRRKWRHACNVG